MDSLLAFGFQYVGHWVLRDDDLLPVLDRPCDAKYILYAFVSEGSVKYIGQTFGSLSKRLKGYSKPGPTQITNIKNHQYIKDLLLSSSVKILAFLDHGQWSYSGFEVNLAAGLEGSLIQAIKPEWNVQGKNKKDISLPQQVNKKSQSHVPSSYSPSGKVQHLKLGKTYYEKGFFNISTEFSNLLAGHNERITIELGSNGESVPGLVNREANQAGNPRIFTKGRLTHWLQSNFNLNDFIKIEFINPTKIRLFV